MGGVLGIGEIGICGRRKGFGILMHAGWDLWKDMPIERDLGFWVLMGVVEAMRGFGDLREV